MEKGYTIKRIVTLLMGVISIYIEWVWYRYFWLSELFPRWVKERLPFWENGHILVLAIYAVLLIVFASLYGGMKLGYYRSTEIILSMIFATIFANII